MDFPTLNETFNVEWMGQDNEESQQDIANTLPNIPTSNNELNKDIVFTPVGNPYQYGGI